jgi:cytochrome c heme-lyase
MSDNTARNEEPKTCPVDHTKLSNKDTEKQACPVNHTALTKDESQKCPVDHTPNSTEKATCPVDPSTYKHFIPPTSNDAEPQSCPVDPSTYKHFVPQEQKPVKQGCDSSAMDSTNNMPKVSEQFTQQDQRMQLGLDRETSTIPRAESQDKLWVYPSEQMFFNAMKRKNWDAKEEDMAVVVPIHNAVNEMAWKKILEWEKMHQT